MNHMKRAIKIEMASSLFCWPRRYWWQSLLALSFLALSLIAQAVTPPPDGGYPGLNTAEGQSTLFNLTTGSANTALGWSSLRSDITGSFNTALGAGTLAANTADENTATGAAALFSNTTGGFNTANGALALFTNKTGRDNTAMGIQALYLSDGDPSNNEGSENSAFGTVALFSNTVGYANSAFGSGAMGSNTTGSFNTASGFLALGGALQLGEGTVATGDDNTATGAYALASNITGEGNTAHGAAALFSNVGGLGNTAVGDSALVNSTGNFNTAVGDGAGSNVAIASNVICIGSFGEDIDNSCFIGNIYSNVQPVIGIDPDYVTIDSNGKLGRSNLNGSSRRFKHDIRPMDKTSEILFALKPVSFRYNKEYDAAQRLSFGLIAEQVAEVAPDLVGHDKQGEPDSVRYEQINAMLLNEFLKEHRKVQQLEVAANQQRNEFEATIAELRKEIESVVARSKERDEKIQKVSGQIEVKKPVLRTVSTEH
jgi:hypothetical protein